jgi:hypothetical protein
MASQATFVASTKYCHLYMFTPVSLKAKPPIAREVTLLFRYYIKHLDPAQCDIIGHIERIQTWLVQAESRTITSFHRLINPHYSSDLVKMNANAGYPDIAEPNFG